MDGYPQGSLDHNVPFIVASGLNATAYQLPQQEELRDGAILVKSGLPPLESKEADVLEEHLGQINRNGASWKGVEKEELYRFRIKTIGRSFVLPRRRAPLPETTDAPESSTPVLHSPFSPLSPISSLYHDGLIDANWIKKHQELVPSILVIFYTLPGDPTTSTLDDNRLKSDIVEVKKALVGSRYRTKLVPIILGDATHRPMALSEGLQERLESIRKGAGLEPKSIYYVPPQESPDELKSVMNNILSVLYGTAVEYYRDLGRHAKKKRSRGTVPQPTVPPTAGTSQTLSLPDWNFRYDFKSAVFAEFRQETDAAMRSFEQAYEILLGQDVLDVIPSWSSRWNEARQLADIIAIRCLRLHFWLGQTSLAVRRWQAHRDRIADFVDRRGRGTGNYGWPAWEARWATVMANMMEILEPAGFLSSPPALYLQPEKALLGERVQPWELLHHVGYWYRAAAQHLAARRTLALAIPDEDRQATQATSNPSASYSYDSYMCPEPHEEVPLEGKGVNHAQLIIDALTKAKSQFASRNQTRMVAELSLQHAKEAGSQGQWEEVLELLHPLWENVSFRGEEWLDIAEDVSWLMRRAAVESGRGDLAVAIDWELMDNKFPRRVEWHADLSKAMDGIPATSKPFVKLSDDSVSSFISGNFAFQKKQSKAGETCKAQLVLRSRAHASSVPISLSSLEIRFEGALRPIVLEHESSKETSESPSNTPGFEEITLEEEFSDQDADELPSRMTGQCNLVLRPDQLRIFELSIPLREAGDAEASSLTLSYRSDSFDMDYRAELPRQSSVGWFMKGSSRPKCARLAAHTLNIQPRPPKMEVKLAESSEQYYANELIELQVKLCNEEDEAANVKLDVHVFGKQVPSFTVHAGQAKSTAEAAQEEARITGFVLGRIDSSSSQAVSLAIDPSATATSLEIHVRASYHLESDTATPISQMLTIQLNVVTAFEANYDLLPRLHQAPWPSLFDYEGVLDPSAPGNAATQPRGFAQNWGLTCHYASFATGDLRVTGMGVKILSIVGGATCKVLDSPTMPAEGIVVNPKTMQEAYFELEAQKRSFDDRQPVSLELAFEIEWQREGGAARANKTTMLMGKYFVLGTEPRVLASVPRVLPAKASGLLQLDLTIENPSNHFLTFGLSMEPSDEFAFSGAKQTTLHLLPMSRRTTTYRLLPLVGEKYVRPGLVVRDKYFQKVLRIIPTEGMKIDKDGLLVWVPAGASPSLSP